MSLLNGGVRSLFGSVFSGIYEDATLTKLTRTEAANGDISEEATNYPVKAHAPARTAAYRAAAGFADSEIEILILQDGIDVSPATDDRLSYAGKTYSVVSAFADGANSQWRVRAKLWKQASAN
jgi:hypothetical protein